MVFDCFLADEETAADFSVLDPLPCHLYDFELASGELRESDLVSPVFVLSVKEQLLADEFLEHLSPVPEPSARNAAYTFEKHIALEIIR